MSKTLGTEMKGISRNLQPRSGKNNDWYCTPILSSPRVRGCDKSM
ncbi:Protein of unknown function [Pyronema omphalodes CBS 100304]|uniref:Uncharacterized protein n=1 Tax=Pyronema omphalodes (strain CBS 100304) TaxID=1076935 RepID=U4KTT4_PYROM|nr:Protein of unknown function [Pyronema omphalodes CBS 100304]